MVNGEFTIDDITTTSGTLSNLQTMDDQTYTVDLTSNATNELIQISVSGGVATSVSGGTANAATGPMYVPWGEDYYTFCEAFIDGEHGHLYDASGTGVSGKTIRMAINGVDQTSVTTGADGVFEFYQINASQSSIFTFYVEDDANNAVTIFIPGFNDVSNGVTLRYNQLIIDDRRVSSSLTSANISTAFVSGESDISSIYSTDGSNNLTMGTSTTLRINTGSLLPSANLDLVNVDIQSKGTLSLASMASATTTVSGMFEKSSGGTFTPSSKTVTLDGTNQTLSGSSLTFYDLTKTGGGGNTLTINGNVTVSHTLTLAGTSAGSKMGIADVGSSIFKLTTGGTQNLSYLSVANMSAAGGEELACTTSCSDGDGNTNWSFSGGGGGGCTATNVQSSRTVVLVSDGTTDIASNAQSGYHGLYFKHGSKKAAAFTYDFSTGDCNFSGIAVTRDDSAHTTVVTNLDTEEGVTTSNITMYVKKESSHDRVYYCYHKDTAGCTPSDSWSFYATTDGTKTTNADFDASAYTVSTTTIDGDSVWQIVGPIGSGGESQQSGGGGGGGGDVPEFSTIALILLIGGCFYLVKKNVMA